MARRYRLRIVLTAAIALGLAAPAFAQNIDRDQFTRERPQSSPTEVPLERTLPPPPPPPPPPVSCPPGQHLEDGFCVADPAPPPAPKYGAIAIGTKNVAWYGVAWNRVDEDDARKAAMDGCMNQARKHRSTNCRVVHTFSGSCVGLAWVNPGNGWGTAVRNAKQEAESAAVSECKRYNPRHRCVLAGAWCSGL